jgi:carboxymethylenebutenolidase
VADLELAHAHGRAAARLFEPRTAPRGAAVVFHSWWGLNADACAVGERLADAGLVALCADLLAGRRPRTVDEAQHSLEEHEPSIEAKMAIARAAIARARELVPSGPLATVGFSMGGAWSIWSALDAAGAVSRAVAYYGAEEGPYPETRAAFLVHVGELDTWDPPEELAAACDGLRAAGAEATLHVYPGCEHWFAEPGRPEHRADAAALAWERTLAFLGVAAA